MVKSIEGIYRDGRVELLEATPPVTEARVIVTFLPEAGPVDLASRGIGADQAQSLRHRLQAFETDWLRDDMDVYDAL